MSLKSGSWGVLKTLQITSPLLFPPDPSHPLPSLLSPLAFPPVQERRQRMQEGSMQGPAFNAEDLNTMRLKIKSKHLSTALG